MWQLVVRSSSPTSTEALNVWHSNETTAQDAANGLESAYLEFAPILSDDADFQIEPVARELDPATGALLSLSGVTWTAPVAGTAVGSRAPDATAVMIGWTTSTIANGRLLRGRTFLPYPGYSVLGEGQISGGGITALDAAVTDALAFLVADQFGIWHRPVGGAGGVFGAITAGFGKREYSYQGRRRN